MENNLIGTLTIFKAMGMTPNFSELARTFGKANAMLDRILHHFKVYQIIGPSYRMKGKEDLFKDE